MNLVSILKFAPKDLKLYSLAHGDVYLAQAHDTFVECVTEFDELCVFDSEGKLLPDTLDLCSYSNAQTILLPSKFATNWNSWWDYLLKAGDIIEDELTVAAYISYGNAISPGGIIRKVSNMKNPSFADKYGVERFLKMCDKGDSLFKFKTPEIVFDKDEKTIKIDNEEIVWFEDDSDFIKSFGTKGFYLDSGDKVVVRNSISEKWTLDFFSYCELNSKFSKKIFHCVGGSWNYCIPFNEATKQLIGT